MGLKESQIDELYRQPRSAFTAQRNALAKTLRGVKTGRALRQAQLRALAGSAARPSSRSEKHRVALREATDAHRKALADATARAGKLAAAQESSPPDPFALSRMLEAVSLAPQPPEPPGRFTTPHQPGGFELFKR